MNECCTYSTVLLFTIVCRPSSMDMPGWSVGQWRMCTGHMQDFRPILALSRILDKNHCTCVHSFTVWWSNSWSDCVFLICVSHM
uniref:Secreted protein n=1 Tax=Pyxicephalus adspersus TaxID=30357 RepID=A0AAV3A7S3_PYXAD|nr:TPA: hypothetical protein GDO54_014557 [Pyxicephalus adspersus]